MFAIAVFHHLYTNLFSVSERKARHHNGFWERPFAFVKHQVVIANRRRTRYLYVSPECTEISRSFKLRTSDENFLDKTDFDIFDEYYAFQFLEEDFHVIDTNSMGIIFDNTLSLPCINRCVRCHGVGSKIHLPLREGSFIFCCTMLKQCAITDHMQY